MKFSETLIFKVWLISTPKIGHKKLLHFMSYKNKKESNSFTEIAMTKKKQNYIRNFSISLLICKTFYADYVNFIVFFFQLAQNRCRETLELLEFRRNILVEYVKEDELQRQENQLKIEVTQKKWF